MKQVARLLILTPVFLLFVICAEAQAKNIVIATSSVVLTNTPIWVGIEKKFFEESGLTVQYIVMRSDLAVKGLITGERRLHAEFFERIEGRRRWGAFGDDPRSL